MATNEKNISESNLYRRNILAIWRQMKSMIFITLGSQKFQFNRLLKEVDKLIGDGVITDRVFAQTGYSDYQPCHYDFEQFLDRDEFARYETEADIIITHGGTGAIIGAVKSGKKVIAVPRLAKYNEHVDDHQVQIIDQFTKMELICGIHSCNELKDGLTYVMNHKFNSYQSNTQAIISSIDKYIERIKI